MKRKITSAFDWDYFEQLAVPSGNSGLIVGQPGDPAQLDPRPKGRFGMAGDVFFVVV